MERKRKPNYVSNVEISGKRPKVADSRGKGQQGRGRCGKCSRSHEGTCRRCRKRAQCLSLAAAGPVSAPAFATLRNTDRRLGREDAPTAKSRAFQLTVEEARAAPDVVSGSFLVSGISALVLFDSGATRSFVLLALSKRFVGAPSELDRPLDVEIADDRTIRVVRIYRDCTLQLFSERYRVDLVNNMK
ncbi:uncharacterized protein LOC111885411 [Lactuca sativa]|uniref:uncharacterized protein LOC111885411 n=1 Tax=Lactuca sativa TaxID=4236 RepID=UPI000CD915C5|nr:uncharacterized protein LOC111885411 [Lactuca sativa]